MRRLWLFLLALLLVACQPIYYVYETDAEAEETTDTVEEYVETRTVDAYALYIVDCDGYIVIEDHCTSIGDYASQEAYYYVRKRAFQIDVDSHQGTTDGQPWELIADGYIYEEPD